MTTMRKPLDYERLADASSLLGVLAGMGLLLPAVLVPELRFLLVPAFGLLIPSLLIVSR